MSRRASAERFGMEQLESRQLMAFVIWDGGGGDDSWHNPLNWSGDAVPGAADNVLIDAPGTPTIRLTQNVATSIASLWSLDKMDLSAGTLAVAGEWKQSAGLAMSGGRIQGGDLTLNGDFSWTGGTIAGASKIRVLPGRELEVGGGVRLEGREVINNGLIDWASGNIAVDGARIRNLEGRTFLMRSPGSMVVAAGGVDGLLVNYGTLAREGTPGSTTTIGIAVSNHSPMFFGPIILIPWLPPLPPPPAPPTGIVDVRTGGLVFTGPVVQKQGEYLNGGDWRVSSSSARLILPGQDVTQANARVALSGAGAAFPQIEAARYVSSLALAGGRAFTFSDPIFRAGSLTLSGSAVLPTIPADELIVQSGEVTITGGGRPFRLEVAAGATLNIGGITQIHLVEGAGVLRLSGDVTWTGGRIGGSGTLLITPSAHFTHMQQGFFNWGGFSTLARRTINYGTMHLGVFLNSIAVGGELVNRGTLTIANAEYVSPTAFYEEAPPGGHIINFGTFNVMQNLTLRGAAGGVRLTNSGTVRVMGGSLVLNGGAFGGGSWLADQGAELVFGGLAGSLNGATLGGAGRIRLASTLAWTNVTVTGTGDMVVTPYGRLTIHGTGTIVTRSSVTNNGVVALADSAAAKVQSNFVNTGELSVGLGNLQVTGDLTLTGTSLLRIRTTGPATVGWIAVQGQFVQDGSLVGAFAWPAQGGARLEFITAANHTGVFDSVTSTGLTDGFVQFSFVGPTGAMTVVSL
jgi:hypothetical protein